MKYASDNGIVDVKRKRIQKIVHVKKVMIARRYRIHHVKKVMIVHRYHMVRWELNVLGLRIDCPSGDCDGQQAVRFYKSDF